MDIGKRLAEIAENIDQGDTETIHYIIKFWLNILEGRMRQLDVNDYGMIDQDKLTYPLNFE